ncbi:protein DMP2-like [Carex rostrata]
MLCFNKITGEQTLKGIAALIKLLPTGTVFAFQFLSALLTNNGNCNDFNKVLTSLLLVGCAFSCCFSSFTDSYVGVDGKLYYGIATKTGLWCFYDPNAKSLDLSSYKLRTSDFVHAFFSTFIFGVVAMLDKNTVECFYPAFLQYQATLLKVLPTVVGGMTSAVFMLFPDHRHGIGYPPSKATQNFTQKDLHKDLLESGSQSFA